MKLNAEDASPKLRFNQADGIKFGQNEQLALCYSSKKRVSKSFPSRELFHYFAVLVIYAPLCQLVYQQTRDLYRSIVKKLISIQL